MDTSREKQERERFHRIGFKEAEAKHAVAIYRYGQLTEMISKVGGWSNFIAIVKNAVEDETK